MTIPRFELEHWFATAGGSCDISISSSDCESFAVGDVMSVEDLRALANTRLSYGQSGGLPELREAIAAQYKSVNPDDVLVTHGPIESIYTLMRATLESGDQVIVQSPLYFPLHAIAREIGCQLEEWTACDASFRFDVKRLASLCDETTKAIVINFPHNPTGAMITENDLCQIARIAEASNAMLISDEVFRLLEYDETHRLPATCDLYERAISVAGLSKIAGAGGLRIGWLVSRDHGVIENAHQYSYYTTTVTNTPCQVIALRAMNHLPQIVERNRELIAANLSRLVEFVSAHPDTFSLVRPQAGTMAVVQQCTGISSLKLCEEILHRSRLLVVPGEFVGLPDGFLRLGLGKADFAEGLSRLEQFVTLRAKSSMRRDPHDPA